jgi:hypothetical protein
LTKIIKEIIQLKVCSLENFNRLSARNDELEAEIIELREKVKLLERQNLEKTIEINNLSEKIDKQRQTIETIELNETSVYHNVLLPEDDMNKRFNEFVSEICIVRPDVQELSVNLEGRYRLWNKVKPTKEMFHALKSYLDTRFKPKKIEGNHGYIGVKLKEIEHKKIRNNSDVENFIFQVCQFSACGKILNSTLLDEYKKWKISVSKEITDDEMREIKEYLDSYPHTLKATVWIDGGSNEGYYGLALKEKRIIPRIPSSTGKRVYKREKETNALLASWDTIAKAAEMESVSTTKMSRYVKNKTIVNDYYYSVA